MLGIFAPALFLLGTGNLQADDLILKNGKVYRNVRVVIQSGFINLIFKSGEIIAVRKSQASRLKRRPVAWKTAFPKAEFERLMQQRINRLHKQIKQREQARKALEETYRLKALLRSAALPGWGQWYKGETLKSGLLFGGFALSIAAYFNREANFSASLKEYDDANFRILSPYLSTAIRPLAQPLTVLEWSRSKSALNDMDNARGASGAALAAILGIYVFNLIDAYFLGNTAKLQGPEQAVGWNWDIQPIIAANARPKHGAAPSAREDGLNFSVGFRF